MNLKTKQTKIRQNHNAIKLMWFLLNNLRKIKANLKYLNVTIII